MKRSSVIILVVAFAALAIADATYDFISNGTVAFYSEQPHRLLIVAGIAVLGGLVVMLSCSLAPRLRRGMRQAALKCGIELPLSWKTDVNVRISRRTAIIGVLLSLFALGNGRFALMLHLQKEPLWLPPTEDVWLTVLGVGSVYLMRIGASQMAIWVASVFMAFSPFARPYRLLGSIVAAWCLVPRLLLWSVRSPHWERFSSSATAIALIFEIVSALVLTGTALLILWLARRLAGVRGNQTISDHDRP